MNRDESKHCVGPGWSGLIDYLFDNLPEGSHVSGIKEKYGGLRVEGYGPDPYNDLEMKVEEMSHTICEECAKPGETRDLNWIRTLCDEHYQSRKHLGGSQA